MIIIIGLKTGLLHTKNCADGKTGHKVIEKAFRKEYSSYEEAIKDKKYVGDHECLKNNY